MRKINFSFILLFSIYSLFAQEIDIPVNLDWDNERHSWKAHWISSPEGSLIDYGVFQFRNSFDLTEVPEKAQLYISADNRYSLFVNGSYVGMGPAKADLTHWKYDDLDISGFLKPGKNTLAVQLVNLGPDRQVAQFSHRSALIVQGGEGLEDIPDTGIAKWRVKRSAAFRPNPVSGEMVGNKYYVVGPCDSIFGAKHDWDWQAQDYDDSYWEEAKSMGKGVGRGYMHGVAWMLMPSSLPQPTDSITRLSTIRRVEGIDADPGFLNGTKSLLVPANTSCKMLLDQGHLTVTMPELVLSGGSDAKIKLTYAETLYDQDGWKRNRDRVEGKLMRGYFDVIIPDGGEERHYQPLWLRTYRYIEVEIQTADEALRIDDLFGNFRMYPFQQKASFHSDDPLLEKIWETGWRTARLCAHDTYWDCPYYEQLQYLGDTRIQALISLYNTGDDRLMVNALRLANESRIPEGLTLSRGPSYIPQIIPAFSLFWIDMIHDHYMHMGNKALISEFKLGMISVLSWFEDRLNTNGMFGASEWLNFADWTEGYRVGSPYGSDEGNSALLSLNFAYALERAAQLFSEIDEPFYAEHYASLAENVRNSVFENCFDEQRGLLAETPAKEHFSQHVNIFGVLTNAIPPDRQQAVMTKVLEDKTLIQTTIYYKFYLFRALDHCNMGNLYLDHMDTWKLMIDKGLSTFEEGDYDERSDCHAWGASPNYDLLSIVCGIRPAEPGFRSVLIKPSVAHLNEIDAVMPHPLGKIEFSMRKIAHGKINFVILLPENLGGDFVWKDERIHLNPGIQEFKLKL